MNFPVSSFGDTFGQWWAVGVWIALYAVALLFVPFYKKSQRKSSSAYLAFVIAMSFEMFGVPLSMFFVGWAFGLTLPEGVLWGHTLVSAFGDEAPVLLISSLVSLAGVVLVVLGWRVIFKRYWSRDEGTGELVTDGIYRFVRHPQYTGFLLITLGMMIDWTTIPLLVMWPGLVVLYYRLARREEADMEREFGQAYVEYKRRTSMLVPLPPRRERLATA